MLALEAGEHVPHLRLDRDADPREHRKPAVLEDVELRIAALPFAHHAVALEDEDLDLRTEEAQESSDPAIDRPGRAHEVDGEALEHGGHVARAVPGLAGDPAVGG